MTQLQYYIAIVAGGLCLFGLALPFGVSNGAVLAAWTHSPIAAFFTVSLVALLIFRSP